MPDNLKSGVENLSGFSMDDVKVHYNSSQPAQLNALAYAQGTDIHVAPGQEKHLAHEAWHVVQQKQGRVKATMQMKEGVPVNDDAGMEQEADVMGAKALQTGDGQTAQLQAKGATAGRTPLVPFSLSSKVVQRVITVLDSNRSLGPHGQAAHADATVMGQTLALGANAPRENPQGWDRMAEKYEMIEGAVYRMHLWNGRLGGPGLRWNLTPGTKDVNDAMCVLERDAQSEVNDGRGVTVETDVTYGHATLPERYYPTHIKFAWTSRSLRNNREVDADEWESDVALPEQKDNSWDGDDVPGFGYGTAIIGGSQDDDFNMG